MKISKAKENAANGTSFSGYVISTTKRDLTEKLGIEPERFDEKVDYFWNLQLENGGIFTIYAWTYGRRLGEGEEYDYHVGCHGAELPDGLAKTLRELGFTLKKVW